MKRLSRRAALAGLTTTACLTSFPAQAQSTDVPLGPKACYLHVHSSDSAGSAAVVPLAGLGAVPGKSLLLEGFGDLDNGPSGDTILSLIGLYSSSPTLLGPELLHRVPGAIDAGVEFISAPTLSGGQPTDIPEDFRITSAAQPNVVVAIPVGALYLFIGNHDSQWFDNSDPDGDLGCRVTVVGTWTEHGAGLAGTAGTPKLVGTGLLQGGDPLSVTLSSARPNAPSFLVMGFQLLDLPLFGGTLVPAPDIILGPLPTSGTGDWVLPATWPAGLPELLSVWFQAWIVDPMATAGLAASNGLRAVTP
ncbi:hypothetical protein [Engelhardtia mirabilis]|uniref:Calcineurin-like phosphoesterase domain-containing protein n=1 Tax=Engelhardtia mirabilis TaxID=2528011 RepID=A0A518BH84_9BACT|nr:hypothetical protein Pla133_14200 [Planctomycetes bacterium Pla133]QDV00676.1 hypothetical protein Pla86_14190 [Planctomycetes bacterium Pla86]